MQHPQPKESVLRQNELRERIWNTIGDTIDHHLVITALMRNMNIAQLQATLEELQQINPPGEDDGG